MSSIFTPPVGPVPVVPPVPPLLSPSGLGPTTILGDGRAAGGVLPAATIEL